MHPKESTPSRDTVFRQGSLQRRWTFLWWIAELTYLSLIPATLPRWLDVIGPGGRQAWLVMAALPAGYLVWMSVVSLGWARTLKRLWGLRPDHAPWWRTHLRLALPRVLVASFVTFWAVRSTAGIWTLWLALGWIVLGGTALAWLGRAEFRRWRVSLADLDTELAEDRMTDLRAFAAANGVPEIGVHIVAPGPQFTGQALFLSWRGHPHVYLTSLAAKTLTARELVAVFSHELAHILCRRCERLWQWAGDVVGITVALLTAMLADWAAMRFGEGTEVETALPAALLGLWIGWFLMTIPRLALSRRIERATTERALALTDDPNALAAAVRKLAGGHAGKPGWLERALFATHPSVSEVLRQCRDYAHRTATREAAPLPDTDADAGDPDPPPAP